MMLAALAGHAQAVLSIDSFRKHATHDNRSIPMWPLRVSNATGVDVLFCWSA